MEESSGLGLVPSGRLDAVEQQISLVVAGRSGQGEVEAEMVTKMERQI